MHIYAIKQHRIWRRISPAEETRMLILCTMAQKLKLRRWGYFRNAVYNSERSIAQTRANSWNLLTRSDIKRSTGLCVHVRSTLSAATVPLQPVKGTSCFCEIMQNTERLRETPTFSPRPGLRSAHCRGLETINYRAIDCSNRVYPEPQPRRLESCW